MLKLLNCGGSDDSSPLVTKSTEIQLRRDGGSAFGMTLRGGKQPHPSLSRPLTVMHVRPNSSADRYSPRYPLLFDLDSLEFTTDFCH